MNKLYEYFDPKLESDMQTLLNNIELTQSIVKMRGLENNQIYLDWLDKLNESSVR